MSGQSSTSTSGPTLGVEEELHVVDAGTGRLCSRAPEVQAASVVDAADGTVVLELTLSQVETVTAVSTDVDQVIERAARLRPAVAGAAAGRGLALVAAGTPVLGEAGEQQVADDERYAALRQRAAGLVPQQLIAGMHVHVGVAGPGVDVADVDDDVRVAVADTVRPWLPTMLALTANSPYWLGEDTGFASYRQVHWQRWPVAGPPPPTQDAAQWHRSVAELVATGVVDDASYVYWDVRLATRFPTVEVRVADVQADAEDAALYTRVVRGLAATALIDHAAHGVDAPSRLQVPQHALRAAMWRAARYGLDGELVDPHLRGTRPAAAVLGALVDAARPGLEVTGDLQPVLEGVRRVLTDGNGAQRQRAAFTRAGWPGVLDVVRVADHQPHRETVNDGNGWVECDCGHRHWGRHGAAGLLLLRPGDRGAEVLLQLRSSWTHQGGTWGLPGGARDSHETTSQAARREAREENDVDTAAVVDVVEHRVDHGSWSYTYVVARAPARAGARVANGESDAVGWVALDDVATRELHPALAAEWSRLHDLVRDLSA
ncbi:MAG: glutamate--cysteine ligase [Rhodoferax sp.]|nr:glutamate--cysteine ligase [Actinomycetota bacterium]